MDNPKLSIIIAMSQAHERQALSSELAEQGWRADACSSGACIMDRVRATPGPHVLLLDTDLSGPDTEQLLEALRDSGRRTAALLLTDRHTANMAGVWAGLGAWGYLLKPVTWARLWLYLDRIDAHFAVLAERDGLRAFSAAQAGAPPASVFISAAMKQARAQARELGALGAAMLISGESGSDKRPLAHEAHLASAFRNGPFIAVDCAAHEPAALDAALFGAAQQDIGDTAPPHPGALACAAQGALFLTEITALSPFAQERLAAHVHSREQTPPLLLVAATNANIALEVGRGRFDAGLFRLFNNTWLAAPPLRERPEDVPALARAALARTSMAPSRRPALSDEAADLLATYYWPGNERELFNVVERAAMRASGPALTNDDILPLLSRYMPRPEPAAPPNGYAFPDPAAPLCDVEKAYIAHVLNHFDFHRQSTAQSLGITRKTLYTKIKQYDLVKEFVRDGRDAGHK
jgi:DNA-binding NtrC family response regulator